MADALGQAPSHAATDHFNQPLNDVVILKIVEEIVDYLKTWLISRLSRPLAGTSRPARLTRI